MPEFETVVDLGDPRLDALRDLPGRAAAGVPGRAIVVEGALSVERALAADVVVQAVVGTPSQLRRLDRAKLPTCTLQTDAALLSELVGFDFHRGVLALVQRPAARPADLDARLHGRFTAVLLERLADPANVGAVIRTAAALGVDLVVCGHGADPYGRRALRASMGHALLRMPWIADSLEDALDVLVARGAVVLAATTTATARDVARVSRHGSLALLLGNEGEGLSDALCRRASEEITIPIAEGADSLNVAAAAAILLYALR